MCLICSIYSYLEQKLNLISCVNLVWPWDLSLLNPEKDPRHTGTIYKAFPTMDLSVSHDSSCLGVFLFCFCLYKDDPLCTRKIKWLTAAWHTLKPHWRVWCNWESLDVFFTFWKNSVHGDFFFFFYVTVMQWSYQLLKDCDITMSHFSALQYFIFLFRTGDVLLFLVRRGILT